MGLRYEFVPVLSLVIAAALCGYTQYRQMADWIANLSPELRVKAGMRGDRTPSESMIGSLLKRIEGEAFDEAFCCWLRNYGGPLAGKVLALDGKYQCATGSEQPKKFLNVIVQDLGIVIKQVPISPAGLEQPEGQQAVESLDVAGSIVTADALYTSVPTAQLIIKKSVVSPYCQRKSAKPPGVDWSRVPLCGAVLSGDDSHRRDNRRRGARAARDEKYPGAERQV